MNAAHLHLIIVHLPIVLVPTGLILYLIGIRWENTTIKLVALSTFVVSSLFAVIAFLLGEGAEEIVEDLAGIAKSAIGEHEDAALLALWITSALGISSLASLILLKLKGAVPKSLVILVLLLGIFSSGILAFTAQEGGKIRHPEAYPDLVDTHEPD